MSNKFPNNNIRHNLGNCYLSHNLHTYSDVALTQKEYKYIVEMLKKLSVLIIHSYVFFKNFMRIHYHGIIRAAGKCIKSWNNNPDLFIYKSQ